MSGTGQQRTGQPNDHLSDGEFMEDIVLGDIFA
jgi:hypothetical protein